LQEQNIGVVPFYVTVDGDNYLKDQIEITSREFYKIQRERKQFFKTSLPSVQDYIDEFSKYADASDILCFCISSKLSGSSQSAENAAKAIMEEHPGRRVIVIDSLNASLGYGLKILEAIKCRDDGKSLDETVKAVSAHRAVTALMVDTLDYLRMGGRIGKASALAGGLLNIKPIIKVVDGSLSPHSKARGRVKGLAALLDILDEGIGGDPAAYTIGVMHADCPEDAETFRDQIEQKYGIPGKVRLADVGLVIGVHVGPAVIAISFVRNNPEIYS